MKKRLKFKLEGKQVEVTGTSVKCKDLTITQKLVSLLMEARANTEIGKDPVAYLFNKHLRFMGISSMRMENINEGRYVVPQAILEMERELELQAA